MKLVCHKGGRTQTFRPHPRAMATILVISSMIFLAAAIAGMTALAAHEARRTRAAQAQTQLRQILLASVPLAKQELSANADAHDQSVALPIEGATLMLQISASNSGKQVLVSAAYHGYKASQTLLFNQQGSQWQLTHSALNQTGGQ
ncbi:MAG TPA: hypothetical protein VGN88_05840 [Phycisphaerae bacterium]|jgi:hypothetical protein